MVNFFSAATIALKTAVKAAELAGMCKGCYIRKPGPGASCFSCGDVLCSYCVAKMREQYADLCRYNAANGLEEPKAMQCRHCSEPWDGPSFY